MAGHRDKTPLGDSIGDIVDRTTRIVHDEIELAKTEIQIALQDLMRGSVAGIVGGVFAFFGLFILLIAFSFLIADAIGALYPWLGFFIVAFFCFAIGGALAFVALKKIKKGSQITPTQAIDEAKQTRDALQQTGDDDAGTIDAVAVEEAVPGAAVPVPGTPAPAPAATATDGSVVVDAVPAATPAAARSGQPGTAGAFPPPPLPPEGLEVDDKQARKLAKQQAKEARRAEKAAAKAAAAEQKAATKAAAKAAKEQAKAEKAAAKLAKKQGAEPPAAESAESAPAAPAPAQTPTPQTPTASGAVPQPPLQPPAPPSAAPQSTAQPPSQPPQPPTPPSDPIQPGSPASPDDPTGGK